MLLLATSLVGLAAMTNAAYISVPSDKTRMPPMGYTSANINLDDGETGKFSFSNLDAYTTADFGAWGTNPSSGNTWTRMMAVHVSKGALGASAISGMKMTYTQNGGTLGAVVHTNSDVLTPTTQEGYWCGMWNAAQLDMDITKPLELTITADCTSQAAYACNLLGVDFKATAFFYQIDSSWASGITYGQTQVWNPNACYGGTWSNIVSDGWKNSGLFATDAIFRPNDNEGFTAYLSDVAFNDMYIAATTNPVAPAGYVEIYDADVFSADGNAYPALTTWVGREVAGSSLGLYATLKSSTGSAGFAAMFCFQSESSFNGDGSLWNNNGNAEYANAQSDYSSWCDIGCYPNPDCSTSGVPAFTSVPTQWDMMDVDVNMVNSQFQQTNGLYVHTLLVGVPGSSVSAPSVPNIQAAFAFGHLPDAATAFGPSALLGFLALAAATLA